MNTARRGGRTVLSAAVALLLLALSLVGLGSAAMAAPAPGQEGAPTSGSLTIHKYAGTPTGQANDGTELNPLPGRQPLSGVEFTVRPVTAIRGVPVDMSTSASWDTLAGYTANPPAEADLTLGAPTTVVTGADGSVTANLPLGLYFVQETGSGAHNITQPVADFLVSIPFPQGAAGWNYNVHVYPKNLVEGEATKTVDDSSAVADGDAVSWTVTSAPLGSGNVGRPLTQFVMADTLDSRLQFVPGSVTVTAGGQVLDPSFYTVTHPGGLGGALRIAMTAQGLNHLGTLDASATVEFTFDTEVHGIGVIPNTATVIVGDGQVTEEYATDPAQTPWGAVVIAKSDADNGEALGGATFQVFDNAAGTGTPITVDVDGTPTTDFVTAADGTVTIPGLKEGTYWLKETVAPVGYTLPTSLFQVDVRAGETADLSTVTREIENQKQAVPELPFTGGNGQLLLTLAGVTLLLVAGGLMLLRSRRNAAQQ